MKKPRKEVITSSPPLRARTLPPPPKRAVPAGTRPVVVSRPVIINVRGLYLSKDAGNEKGPAVVNDFIARLKESPYFEPIEDAKEGYMRANDDTNEWAFKFVLPLRLKNPIALQ